MTDRTEYYKQWYKNTRTERIKYSHEWYLKNKARVKANSKRSKQRIYNNPTRYAEYKKYNALKARVERLQVKAKVMRHYSPNLKCMRCGISNIHVLSIDHIQGNGKQHRQNIGNIGGFAFYRWLHRNKYPLGFQVLCMNCQFIKRVENNETKRKYK